MAKSHNQKGKILFLEQMLRETGEDRAVSMQEILAKLTEYGISAERKSIYDDIEALRDFGMDVKYKRGRPGGYYLAGQTAPEKADPVPEKEAFAPEPAETEVLEPAEQRPRTETREEPKMDWKIQPEAVNEKKQMKLLCDNKKKKEIRAYFGKYAEYKEKGLGYFTVTAPQMSGPQFFGWLTAMGKEVHILKPKKLAASYRDYLKILTKEYKGI